MHIVVDMAERRSGGVLIAIGIFKVVKVALLVLAGLAALKLLHRDAESEVWNWIERFNVNPTRPIVQKALGGAGQLDAKKLHEVIATSFTYAVLLSIEATGLLLRKRWGEYATVLITGSLLPFEIWELCKEVTATRVIALAVNLAIVVYLIVRLVKHRREDRRPRQGAMRPAHA